jgi:hypothetical protein
MMLNVIRSNWIMWRPALPGNEDVLICINTSFFTQRLLKPLWPWTYQNFAVKRAFMRVALGWVTSWEVWFRGAKSRQYCVIGGVSLQILSKLLPSLRWGERAQAHEGRQQAPAGMPRMEWSYEGPQRGHWVPRGGDCDVSYCLGMRMCLYV